MRRCIEQFRFNKKSKYVYHEFMMNYDAQHVFMLQNSQILFYGYLVNTLHVLFLVLCDENALNTNVLQFCMFLMGEYKRNSISI